MKQLGSTKLGVHIWFQFTDQVTVFSNQTSLTSNRMNAKPHFLALLLQCFHHLSNGILGLRDTQTIP